MSTIIGADACANCVKSETNDVGQRFCRALPPQIVAVIGSTVLMKEGKPVEKQGVPVLVTQTTGFETRFPRVDDEMWCAQHSKLMTRGMGIDLKI